ncbi:MAG TPA: hypothetical protein ENJ29_11155 [Bacteroidetes bacterium]|nr:hypothetical protein [Bacteroidota bacterium]
MKSRHIIVLAVVLSAILASVQPGRLAAQNGQTLAPYHWGFEYFRDWRLRHPVDSLFVKTWPLLYQQAEQVFRSQQARTGYERFLKDRFLADAGGYGVMRGKTKQRPFLQLGARLVEDAGRISDELRSRMVLRLLTGVAFSDRLTIFNAMALDQRLRDDPDYEGKEWRGLTAITEQAYVNYHTPRWSVKFGRDYILLSPGEDAALTVSDASRPFDLLQVQMRARRAQFTYITTKLNTITLSDSTAERLMTPWAQRYMSVGRVEFAFRDYRMQLGLTQTILYGGTRGFEWYYLNPFIAWHGEQLNEPQDLRANTMGAVDLTIFPTEGVEIYSQLLIDDIQVEKKSVGDLEPNEIGMLFGLRFADPGPLQGVTLGAEYTRVTNRTYNTVPEAEKYVHRNKPIGHFLGNDFDRYLLYSRIFLPPSWLIKIRAEYRRHGEGRVNVPFDMPWREYTLEQGYSEPFPFGIVETTRIAEASVRWHPRSAMFGALTVRYTSANNWQNLTGSTLNRFEVFLSVWLEWQGFGEI